MLLGTSGGWDRSGQTERRTVVGLTACGVVFRCPQSSTTQARLLSVGIAIIVSMPWLLDNTLTVGSPFFPLLTGLFGLWTMDRNPKCQLGGGPYRWRFSGGTLDRVVGLPILRTLAMECDPLAGSGWAGHGTKK